MTSRSILPCVPPAWLLAVLLCTGCFPMNVTRSPGVSGVVVDAGSGGPVAGAEVLVSKATYRIDPGADAGGGTVVPAPPPLSAALAAARRPTATTGADGRFTIPPEKRWIMVTLGSAPAPPAGTVVVRRSGYATALLDVSGRTKDMGSIALTPAP